MSNAFSGVGTVFSRSADGGVTWGTIAEINEITGPDKSRNTIDTTSLDTTGGYRTFIASFRDAGQITLAMNFTAAGYDLINQDFEDSAAKMYKIALPDTSSSTFTFNGLVVNLSSAIPTDDKVSANVTIKITGPVTFTFT